MTLPPKNTNEKKEYKFQRDHIEKYGLQPAYKPRKQPTEQDANLMAIEGNQIAYLTVKA